jgi:hypothetical protein
MSEKHVMVGCLQRNTWLPDLPTCFASCFLAYQIIFPRAFSVEKSGGPVR